MTYWDRLSTPIFFQFNWSDKHGVRLINWQNIGAERRGTHGCTSVWHCPSTKAAWTIYLTGHKVIAPDMLQWDMVQLDGPACKYWRYDGDYWYKSLDTIQMSNIVSQTNLGRLSRTITYMLYHSIFLDVTTMFLTWWRIYELFDSMTSWHVLRHDELFDVMVCFWSYYELFDVMT